MTSSHLEAHESGVAEGAGSLGRQSGEEGTPCEEGAPLQGAEVAPEGMQASGERVGRLRRRLLCTDWMPAAPVCLNRQQACHTQEFKDARDSASGLDAKGII